MRRGSSSVSWKRRERVGQADRWRADRGRKSVFKSTSSSSSSISPSRSLAGQQSLKMLCQAVLLVATCYGLAVSAAAPTTAQIKTANVSPQTEGLARDLNQTEGALLVAQRRRFARSGQRFKSDFETAAPSNNSAGSQEAAGRAGQQTDSSADRSAANRLSPGAASIRNVTAQNGQSVLLHCPVEPSAEGAAVSWFRGTGELQLLSYESSTIIQDERFVVRHIVQAGNEHDWALQIKSLDKSADSGLYQCQTNSEPPQSQYYQLNVVEPQVHILGAPDMVVKLGSSINLTCVISQSPDQLQFVFWYRDQRMINYDINERGKIVMSKLANKQDTMVSNLQILNSRLTDSGKYTCTPSGARPMAIQVHVVEGTDKRLIMFQNDYDPTASAASSQQTNSALSVHVVRPSRGRLYALFLVFVIFSSWFQLVAQTQTAISLLLLAIIGFLLGRATDTDTNPRQLPIPNPKHLEAVQVGEPPLDQVGGRQRRRARGGGGKRQPAAANTCSSPQSSANSSSATDSCEPRSADDSTGTMDPLIKRANGALNMLKTLSSASSEDELEVNNNGPADGEQARPIRSNKSIGKHMTTRCDTKRATIIEGQPMRTDQALTSPSALSSTSSTGSTGYNSDTRSTNLTRSSPTPLRVLSSPLVGARDKSGFLARPSGAEGDDEDQMIELVSQPTALRLVMDEFSARSTSSCSQPADRYAGQPEPSRCLHQATGSLDGEQGLEEPAEEPHYSSPTLSFVQRPGKLAAPSAADGATCRPP